MGCCDKSQTCCDSKPKAVKRVSWLGLILVVLAVLVVVNWQ